MKTIIMPCNANSCGYELGESIFIDKPDTRWWMQLLYKIMFLGEPPKITTVYKVIEVTPTMIKVIKIN